MTQEMQTHSANFSALSCSHELQLQTLDCPGIISSNPVVEEPDMIFMAAAYSLYWAAQCCYLTA